jgi:hypothetical protein
MGWTSRDSEAARQWLDELQGRSQDALEMDESFRQEWSQL